MYSAGEVLKSAWGVGAAAFVISLVTTPIVRLIAYRAKAVDRPDDLLKPHARPTAYLGGVAMCVGLLAGLVTYVASMGDLAGCWGELKSSLQGGDLTTLLRNPLWNIAAIALASVGIMILGLVDDVREISPRKKVYGQALAAAVLLVGGVGYRMATVIPRHRPASRGAVPGDGGGCAGIPAVQHPAGQHLHGRRRQHAAGVLRGGHDGFVLPGGRTKVVRGGVRDLRPADLGYRPGGGQTRDKP